MSVRTSMNADSWEERKSEHNINFHQFLSKLVTVNIIFLVKIRRFNIYGNLKNPLQYVTYLLETFFSGFWSNKDLNFQESHPD